jgi:hypothetical protein
MRLATHLLLAVILITGTLAWVGAVSAQTVNVPDSTQIVIAGQETP